jgi:hypothetical protein
MIDAEEIVAENIAIALGNDPNLDVPSPPLFLVTTHLWFLSVDLPLAMAVVENLRRGSCNGPLPGLI